MIPDKIYISQGLSKEAVKALSLYLNDKDICYIRKEAILKWAKECTASFQEQMDYHKEKSNAHNILVGGVSTIEMLTSFLESL